MPINPALALQVKGLELPDPMAQMAQVTQIQNALQQQRMGDIQMQNALREQRRKGEFERILGGFGPEAKVADISPALVRGGFLTEARTLMQSDAQLEETRRKAEEARLKGVISQADIVGRVLGAAKDQDSFDFAVRKLSEQGIFKPADVQFLGTTYDPARVKQILDTTMSQKDRLETAFKERTTAATETKAQAATSQAQTAAQKAQRDRVPMSVQEFEAFNRMAPDQQAAFTAFRASQRPTTTITNDLRQESALVTALGKEQAEAIAKGREGASSAASNLATINTGRQLLKEGVITGTGAEFLVNLNQALKTAGIDFGYADAAANSQAFSANMAQSVGQLIKQFGAGTGLSNADREYAEKMAGGKITLDEKAIRRILDINERASRNVIATHNKFADKAGKAAEAFKVEEPTFEPIDLPSLPAAPRSTVPRLRGSAPSAAPVQTPAPATAPAAGSAKFIGFEEQQP